MLVFAVLAVASGFQVPRGGRLTRRVVAVKGGADFASTVAPSLGVALSNAMFLSAVPAVLEARKNGSLGDLNPVPWAFILANCIAWLHYSFCVSNPYAFASNALGAVLGLFFTLTGVALGTPSQRNQLMAVAVVTSAATITASFWTCFLLKTAAARQILTGYFANIILVVFYGAPLSTLKLVLRDKSAASIYAPLSFLSLLNGSLWVVYGVAIRDFFIVVPNFCGLVLALVQLAFKLIF